MTEEGWIDGGIVIPVEDEAIQFEEMFESIKGSLCDRDVIEHLIEELCSESDGKLSRWDVQYSGGSVVYNFVNENGDTKEICLSMHSVFLN